ncbi:MAG: HAD family phosphatase [Clostridiales bacterium]|nr:HAD family phosphatase [Clostridiales bacterium]
MIKNIVFDIGNVLVDFCWREHIAGLGFAGETAERLGKAMMQNPVWNEIDRGVWSNDRLLEGFIANDPELEQEIRLVFSDLGTIVREREGSAEWVRSLREEGYHTYYLSNYSARVKEEAADQLSFLREMDGGVMSYTVQQIKPEPDIYRTLFDRYGLKPEESVFLDDSAANIEMAGRLGMHAILVESQQQAMRELRQLLEKKQ